MIMGSKTTLMIALGWISEGMSTETTNLAINIELLASCDTQGVTSVLAAIRAAATGSL